MFFNWIYRCSNTQILIILILFFVVLLDVMLRILQTMPMFAPPEDSADSSRLGLIPFGSIITLSGLLIGFLLNQAQTIKDEWDLLKVGQGGGKVTHILGCGISRQLLCLESNTNRQTVIYNDFLKKAEAVAETGKSRIEQSSARLPHLFWVFIVICMLFLPGINTLFLPSDSSIS